MILRGCLLMPWRFFLILGFYFVIYSLILKDKTDHPKNRTEHPFHRFCVMESGHNYIPQSINNCSHDSLFITLCLRSSASVEEHHSGAEQRPTERLHCHQRHLTKPRPKRRCHSSYTQRPLLDKLQNHRTRGLPFTVFASFRCITKTLRCLPPTEM